MRDVRAVLSRRSGRVLARTRAVSACWIAVAAVCVAVAPAPARAADSEDCPWLGSTASADERAHQVLERMTVDEKISMTGLAASPEGYENYTPAIPRLCVPQFTLQDGPAGVAAGFKDVTQLPAPIAVAASFDRDVARRYGEVQGQESWGKGIDVAQGPDVNIARVPQHGRTFEAYGEDPHLAGEQAVANIHGIQSQGAMADIKHFAANNQETNRLTIDETIAERTLREIYFPAFEAAVERGHVATMMCAYNQVNSKFACQNPFLMTDVFKGEWGFEGFIRSDFGAIHDPAAAFNAGMDQAKPQENAALKAAIESGAVPMARLDDAVFRVLREMFRYDLFDHGPTGTPKTPVTSPEHADVARDAAAAGTVLLKNDGGALPLDTSTTHSIAVIGADGGDGAYTAGGGSSHVIAPYVVTPYEAVKDRAGDGVEVTYTAGAHAALPAVGTEYLTPPTGQGTGLLGRYFNNETRSGTPVLTRTDPNVDFTWGVGQNAVSPGPGVNAEHWSASWTGTLDAPQSGEYTFSLTSDDGGVLFVDGNKVVDNGGNHALQSTQGNVTLTAGAHAIEIQYFNGTAGDSVHLGWQLPGTDPYADVKQAAAKADVAVVFANDVEGEGADRRDLTLPFDQDKLIAAAAAANPHTIVVLHTGSAVTMPWLGDVQGVVEGWYAGQEDGNAIASVLFGDVNPSGKLPLTFPKDEADTPAHTPEQWPGVGGTAQYTEGLLVGYRWYDAKGIEPLFPFGYGLSYTSFRVSGLTVTPRQLNARGDAHATVTATVTNTGPRAGAEVVQLYVGSPASGEPPKRLAGYRKVALAPGRSARVRFALTPRDLAYWDEDAHGWMTARGDYPILVGTSSRDLPLAGTLTVSKSAGPVSVAADAPQLLDRGASADVTATFANGGEDTAHDVDLALALPEGWTAAPQTATHLQSVAPGERVTARWRVTVPADAAAGAYPITAHASYAAPGGPGERSDTTEVQVPYPSLAAAFDNVGISDDADHAPGNLDGAGNSYSAQALADAGLTRGGDVVHAGIHFTWPDVPAGTPDNVDLQGQVVALSGSGATLGILGAGANGSHSASGSVVYADGSEQPFDLTLTDWFSSAPAAGNELVATTAHLNRTNGKPPAKVRVWYAGIPLQPGKEVAAVRLPNAGSHQMHAFAMGIGR